MRNDLRSAHYNSISPGTHQRDRETVIAALAAKRAATPKELANYLGREITSIRPRLSELRKDGLVLHTGVRRNKEHELQLTSALT